MAEDIKRLDEYAPSAFAIEDVLLEFELGTTATRVRSRMHVRRSAPGVGPLVLDGEALSLDDVRLDERPLTARDYAVAPDSLTILSPPETFVLEVEVTIDPSSNTELRGLYLSGGRFCTQCEAEGFRRITYFLDRPDVLTRYQVRIVADESAYPTLLSNGNLVESGRLDDGRHFATWHDPFPKPSYLFALVAGTFDSIHDRFVTMSGKAVALSIHVDPGNAGRAHFAMNALKRAIRWDERRFKREYDLSQFHIVAVRDFNYGAMENKGLNIFNSSVLLADSATETDDDFASVERVVAHEYFHNWTGNRITLRDWFQLCLKEGLTVYRDQEFSADENSRPVQRIHDVEFLRTVQFPEDAGPLAHPVRPGQFRKIDNFYTPTVYRKGAEVVRVLSALVGPDAFDRGMQRYFDTFDGKAVTVEDFVACFRETSHDLPEFFGWYTQPGTPHVTVRQTFDPSTNRLVLSVRQETPASPTHPSPLPVPIPLRVGFLGGDGRELEVRLTGGARRQREHRLVLDARVREWAFEDVPEEPVVAVMRGFMAPVTLDDGLDRRQRLVQLAHDPDAFTRWDASQRLLTEMVMARAEGREQDGPSIEEVLQVLERELGRAQVDPAFVALALDVPSLTSLAIASERPDPDALHAAREGIRRAMARQLERMLIAATEDPRANDATRSGPAIGFRSLRAVALSLLGSLGEAHADRLQRGFDNATTMTAEIAALRALRHVGGPRFDSALLRFEARWREQPLVMDKWFAIQAADPADDAIERVRALARHDLFSLRIPNRARALFGVFGTSNLRAFHAADGTGYELLERAICAADAINPLLAGRFARAFATWKRFDDVRQGKARGVLERLSRLDTLSSVLRELVENLLA